MQAAIVADAPTSGLPMLAFSQCAGDADADLIERARADPAAFGILYDRYLERIFRFIYARVHQRTVAEDITEEVFLSALRNIKRYRDQGVGLRPWLYRIALNAIANYYRRGDRSLAIDAVEHEVQGTDDVLTILAKRDRMRQVWAAVGRLPRQQRRAIILRFSADLSTRETAEAMGKSAGAVKLLVYRAVQRLRGELGPQEG